MSNLRERVLSFTAIETTPLPRPLHRFGTAFPVALAESFAGAYGASLVAEAVSPIACFRRVAKHFDIRR